MSHPRASPYIIASLYIAVGVGTGSGARADDWSAADQMVPGQFKLDANQLDPIRFTRLPADLDERLPGPVQSTRHHTDFSLSLSPGRFDFTRQGAYGLGLLFADPEIAVESVSGFASVSASTEASHYLTNGLNDGLRYSAGVRIEHEDADIDGTAYVSSSLLGLSYGRLGRLWYGGIDVNFQQYSDERYGEDQRDNLSLDVTTGRRLGITGLGVASPLWLLSLRGDFDLLDAGAEESLEADGDWYLNPSLFWHHPGFTFSAQMEVPVDMTSNSDGADDAAPDYRLRAVFKKRFK